VDPTMLLTAFGGFGSAVSAGNALGGAVITPGSTDNGYRIGSWVGGVAGTASGVFTGSAATANLVASSAAATAQAAATAAEIQSAVWAGAASQSAFLQGQATTAATASAAAQAQATAAQQQAAKSKWPAPILIAANIVHVTQNMLNGFGSPNKGDILETAAGRLDLAAKDLTMAANTTGWTNDDGGAEANYSRDNRNQQERVEAMAAIDRSLKGVLTKQAGQVADIRGAFGYVTAVYAVAIPACGAMTANGLVKESINLQIAIASACAIADTAAQSIHHTNVIANRDVIQGLATQYQDLATAATAYLTGVKNKCCPHAAQTTTP